MYSVKNYWDRGTAFLKNSIYPTKKKLSKLMIYGTDLCDSACKHCMIWKKRPVHYLPFEKIIEVMNSNCVTKKTSVGLVGGEFLFHPEAMNILKWFRRNHRNFDLLTNALRPDDVIEAVEKYPPNRLFVSLDGPEDTYHQMRGKDGYDRVIGLFEKLHQKIPISAMFTLSPYNDFKDLEHVAKVCKRLHIDLRVGVYNNISFFDTQDKAHFHEIGSLKNSEPLTFSKAKSNFDAVQEPDVMTYEKKELLNIKEHLPDIIKEFDENYDYLILYDEWRKGNLKLNCYSILDSLVLLPNGDVPICQNLDVLMGNLHTNTLDEILNSPASVEKQKHYVKNCNACWINFHRKYDIVLYRNFERFFGAHVTSKMLGYYWWQKEKNTTYKQVINS
jgi:sulfatase maturation enzyme AslB (radical SAM superfamily)